MVRGVNPVTAPASGVYRLDTADFPGAGVVAVGETDLNSAYVNADQGTGPDRGEWDGGNDGYKITMPGNTGSDGAGGIKWRPAISGGAGDIVTIAYRSMCNEAFITGGGDNTSDGGKVHIGFGDSGGSCSNDELTIQNIFHRQHPTGYINCGSPTFDEEIGGGGEIRLQGSVGSTNVSCSYQNLPAHGNWNGDGLPCHVFVPDAWKTTVVLMDMSGAGCHTEIWMRYDEAQSYNGQTLTNEWYLVWDIPDSYSLRNGSMSLPDEIDSLYLTSYATGKSSGNAHDTWESWYNDALVDDSKTWAQVKTIYGIT